MTDAFVCIRATQNNFDNREEQVHIMRPVFILGKHEDRKKIGLYFGMEDQDVNDSIYEHLLYVPGWAKCLEKTVNFFLLVLLG